jgi:hypothetical protein
MAYRSKAKLSTFKLITDRKISNDAADDLNSNKIINIEETNFLARARPPHGIKFSKSAASLMDNASSNGSQTPTS